MAIYNETNCQLPPELLVAIARDVEQYGDPRDPHSNARFWEWHVREPQSFIPRETYGRALFYRRLYELRAQQAEHPEPYFHEWIRTVDRWQEENPHLSKCVMYGYFPFDGDDELGHNTKFILPYEALFSWTPTTRITVWGHWTDGDMTAQFITMAEPEDAGDQWGLAVLFI